LKLPYFWIAAPPSGARKDVPPTRLCEERELRSNPGNFKYDKYINFIKER
jgi:hypothetical protein